MELTRPAEVNMAGYVTETVKDAETGLEYATQVRWLKREIAIRLTNRAQLEPDEEVCREILNPMVSRIAKQIAPYKEVVYRALMKDKTKNPDLEAADELVKGNLYDQALGDLDSALRIAKEVVDRTANSTAMGEYSRLLKEKQSLERLKEQLQ